MPDKKILYCMDSTVFITLHQRYPKNVFPGIWEGFEELVNKEHIISSFEVFKEIEAKEDALLTWAKTNKSIFQPLSSFDKEQQEYVSKILNKYPNLIPRKKKKAAADPFVIALAIAKGCKAVSDDNKLPAICSDFKIECISLVELFTEQKWKLEMKK